MKSLPLENPHHRIGAPNDWDHERDGVCHTLEVWDVDGYLISAWQPTVEELKRLNEGKPLLLHVRTRRHPVVGLCVADEPQEETS